MPFAAGCGRLRWRSREEEEREGAASVLLIKAAILITRLENERGLKKEENITRRSANEDSKRQDPQNHREIKRLKRKNEKLD